MKVCLEPGCPSLQVEARCTAHRTARERERGSRQQRGYGTEHARLRADVQAAMNRGRTYTCWRCGDELDPEHWHLGHDDDDRTQYRGPECVPCNTATSGRISQMR